MTVTIHTKRGCPYCEKAKLLLFSEGIKYKEVEYVPGTPDYDARRQALIEKTFHGTFPQVFLGPKFIGGYTELLHTVRRANDGHRTN